MSQPAVVQIIGAPVACTEGFKDAWRQTAHWAAGQLASLYGDSVSVVYYDLFEPDCPQIPDDAQLPLVLVNGQVVSSGGKISIPVLRKSLEELGVASLT